MASNDYKLPGKAQFDPYDRNSWYFGKISREDTNRLLEAEEDGVFLVRDSTSFAGEYVLSVRESGRDSNNSVSHYKITPLTTESGDLKYKIGDSRFPDLPSLLNFYKLHFLDKTTLVKPLPRQLEKYIARYDYAADMDSERDLSFKRGESLFIVKKGEDESDLWWTAKNAFGREGQVPANYLELYSEDTAKEIMSPRNSGGQPSSSTGIGASDSRKNPQISLTRRLPARAKVKQARVPNAYDRTALRLELGDIIKVTKMDPSGTWEGELNGKVGHFPFNYVEWLDDVAGPTPSATHSAPGPTSSATHSVPGPSSSSAHQLSAAISPSIEARPPVPSNSSNNNPSNSTSPISPGGNSLSAVSALHQSLSAAMSGRNNDRSTDNGEIVNSSDNNNGGNSISATNNNPVVAGDENRPTASAQSLQGSSAGVQNSSTLSSAIDNCGNATSTISALNNRSSQQQHKQTPVSSASLSGIADARKSDPAGGTALGSSSGSGRNFKPRIPVKSATVENGIAAMSVKSSS